MADAHDRLAARAAPTGLELQPTKTKVWAPNMENPHGEPEASGGGLLIVGEALGADDEEAQVLGTSPFVHEHLRKIAELVAQDCVKIQHLPDHLVAQEAGMQLRLRPPPKAVAQPHSTPSPRPGHHAHSGVM